MVGRNVRRRRLTILVIPTRVAGSTSRLASDCRGCATMTGRVKVSRRCTKHAMRQRYSRRLPTINSHVLDERYCSAKCTGRLCRAAWKGLETADQGDRTSATHALTIPRRPCHDHRYELGHV